MKATRFDTIEVMSIDGDIPFKEQLVAPRSIDPGETYCFVFTCDTDMLGSRKPAITAVYGYPASSNGDHDAAVTLKCSNRYHYDEYAKAFTLDVRVTNDTDETVDPELIMVVVSV